LDGAVTSMHEVSSQRRVRSSIALEDNLRQGFTAKGVDVMPLWAKGIREGTQRTVIQFSLLQPRVHSQIYFRMNSSSKMA